MSNIPSGTGSLFTPHQELLSDLLPRIHAHHIALPNFQRPWVWEPEMVRDLLLSVAYRYPAGSLLTMPVPSGDSTFALRPFQGSEVEGSTPFKAKPNLMVLDGQQRLTSLYQAAFSERGVLYEGRIYWFYLDVASLLGAPDSEELDDSQFDAALFFVLHEKSGKRVRYAGLRPLYEITTSELEVEHGALPLQFIFRPEKLSEWRDVYLEGKAKDDFARYKELGKQWEKKVKPWVERIRTYSFPIVELKQNVPLSAICHIFEKVNSKGVPLDVFDLSTAILWAQGFHLNERWKTTWQLLRKDNILPMQPLYGTWFLQGISLLDSYERKQQATSGNIGGVCRRQDLMKLGRPSVERWWDVLLEGYEEASKFMLDQGVIAERILPYSTLIVPLTAILAQLRLDKGAAHIGAAWPKVAQWYWCSIFSQRYSSRVETAAAQDFEQVIAWINGGNEPDVVRSFSFRAEALEEITSIRNAIYKAILCLLTREGARDFGGSGKLMTNLFHSTKQDHHHIFPTKALEDLEISDPRSDSIVNKTLISAAVNQSIGGRKPSAYVASWRGKLGADEFDTNLASHAVNADILASDDWEAFVNDRREKLRLLMEKACGKSIVPFASAAVTSAPNSGSNATASPLAPTPDDEAKEEPLLDNPTIADEELTVDG